MIVLYNSDLYKLVCVTVTPQSPILYPRRVQIFTNCQSQTADIESETAAIILLPVDGVTPVSGRLWPLVF